MLTTLGLVGLLAAASGAEEADTATDSPRDTPLDTQPLEATRVDIATGGTAELVSPSAPTETFFTFDPFARGRGLVVTPADMGLACAGAGALRDAALACPLDHQVALRGLPGLLEACSSIGRGGILPSTATPVPHAATVRAAADARAASAARLMEDCGYRLAAQRDGNQLQVSVPASSGVVEVRVGWRRQPNRPLPDAPPPPVTWLQPVYESTMPVRREDVARIIDLGELRPERGWWSFDLAVEVLDAAGAATRVVMPVDIEVGGATGVVDLGPSLEVSVGTGSGNRRLSDLPIPPESAVGATNTRGRPGTDRTPGAGSGTDPSAIDIVLDACEQAPQGITATSCRRLTDPTGRLVWPPDGSGPVVGAAARDDLIGLLRRFGERTLRAQAALPADQRSWAAEDISLVVASLGGMLEAMVRGSDPISAMAAWSRQRAPTLPTGERFGYFQDDTHRVAPLASTLYIASLLAASTAEPVDGPGQAGMGLLTLASNLSWTENLPGGIRAPWSGMTHPRMGEADLGWLASVALAADDARRTIAPIWNDIRRGGDEVVPALGAVHGQATSALLAASMQIPDQSGHTREARAKRQALLDRLLGRLPEIYIRIARGDMGGTADTALAWMDDPELRELLPAMRRVDLAQVGALATLATSGPGSVEHHGRTRGLVGVVGVGVGPGVSAGEVGLLAAPSAALAWQQPVQRGRAEWALRVPLVDLGAPWAITFGSSSLGSVYWPAVFSPGLQAAWSPAPESLAWTGGLRLAPAAGPGEDSTMGLRLELGITRAVHLAR
jgi:hypothetical protein